VAHPGACRPDKPAERGDEKSQHGWEDGDTSESTVSERCHMTVSLTRLVCLRNSANAGLCELPVRTGQLQRARTVGRSGY